MAAGEYPMHRASALQAATVLAYYGRDLRSLVDTWLDIDLYLTVSRQVDAATALCSALPPLKLPAARFLIAHSELMLALWSAEAATLGVNAALAQQVETHLTCTNALAQRCIHLSGS